MNYLSHALVAYRVLPEANPDYWAGSTLPDFIGMAGGALRIAPDADTRFLKGTNFHLLTDSVWDSSEHCRILRNKLAAELKEIGAPRWARILYPTVGTELLIDGAAAQWNSTHDAWRHVRNVFNDEDAPRAISSMIRHRLESAQSTADLASRICNLAYNASWSGYSDPRYVFAGMRTALSTRGRVCESTPNQDLAIIEALARQRDRIWDLAEELFASAISRIEESLGHDKNPLTSYPLFPNVDDVYSMVVPLFDVPNEISPEIAREIERYSGNLDQPGRLRCFIAGRLAAHLLIESLTSREWTVSQPDNLLPSFPPDWIGSLSHSNGCGAVIMSPKGRYLAVGTDLETEVSARRDLTRRVTSTEQERELIAAGVSSIVFASIREAGYKAYCHLGGQNKYGWTDAEVVIYAPGKFEIIPVHPEMRKEFKGIRRHGRYLHSHKSDTITTICVAERD